MNTGPRATLACLALLAFRPTAQAAEHTDILPTPDDLQTLRGRSQPDSALDRWHDRIFLGVQDFISKLDSRFVEPGEEPLPVPVSPFRIGLESDAIRRTGGSIEARPRADLDVQIGRAHV